MSFHCGLALRTPLLPRALFRLSRVVGKKSFLFYFWWWRDTPVRGLVVVRFATVLVGENPGKSVPIPGVVSVCELESCVAVGGLSRRHPRLIAPWRILAAVSLSDLQRGVRLVLDLRVVDLSERAACHRERKYGYEK